MKNEEEMSKISPFDSVRRNPALHRPLPPSAPFIHPQPTTPPAHRPIRGVHSSPERRPDPPPKPVGPTKDRHRIRDIYDIPRDVSRLTNEDVIQCLRLLNMDRYARQFNENQINGSLLVTLDESTLIGDLNMNRLDAKRLVMFCKGWRPD